MQESPIYLSQSECGAWVSGCAAAAWARFVLGYRPPDDEDRPRRIGSMGHAVLADRVDASFKRAYPDPLAAIEIEAVRRGWPEDWPEKTEETSCAMDAAATVADRIGLDSIALVPDLYSEDASASTATAGKTRGPLAEVRLRARWSKVAEFFADVTQVRGAASVPVASAPWLDIMRCLHVRQRFSGIEGQPDLVCMPEGVGGPVVVMDFKFRQRPDLGGAAEPDTAGVPDRQAAWYLALLHAVGLRPAGGLEFWQVNAFAGRWLTVQDFIDAANGELDSEAACVALVTEDGVPRTDLKKIGQAGMATAEVWGEAHRILVNRRYEARMAKYDAKPAGPKGGKGRAPDRLTENEQRTAQGFLADLRHYDPVAIKRFRADQSVSREVIRDMIVGVDAHLGSLARGIIPARNLQSYPNSPCVKERGGCPVRQTCLATLGTSNFERALHDLKDQGALVHHATAPRLGAVPKEFTQ